jgi:hypothetical protein
LFSGSDFPTTEIATFVVEPHTMRIDPESEKTKPATQVHQRALGAVERTESLVKNRISQELSPNVPMKPPASAQCIGNETCRRRSVCPDENVTHKIG